MNWFHFLTWVAGLYLIYYLALILFDYSRNKRPQAALSGELTFTEDILPKRIEHLPDKTAEPMVQAAKTDSPIIGSGGVSLKNLFGLCREEAIIYTRPVSF
jgi:hypothetical protein